MRLLVTGGAGYIGSHTVVELVGAGHDVEIVDDLANARSSVLGRLVEVCGRDLPLHRVDLRDRSRMDALIGGGGFEGVVHFAGLKAVGESVERPIEYYDVNVGGTAILLDAARRHGVRRVVFSSSATVYGEPGIVPVTEDTPLRPATSPYGRSKRMIETMLEDLHACGDGWQVAVLRYFNPAGAHPSGLIGEDPRGPANNLMPTIARVAAGTMPEVLVFGDDYPTADGTGVRDYVHVMDLAAGHVAALEALRAGIGFRVWNLGTGRPTSVRALVDLFARVNDVEVPTRVVARRPGDLAELWADPSRAERELGWRAERTLEDMCRDTWRWQRQAGAQD